MKQCVHHEKTLRRPEKLMDCWVGDRKYEMSGKLTRMSRVTAGSQSRNFRSVSSWTFARDRSFSYIWEGRLLWSFYRESIDVNAASPGIFFKVNSTSPFWHYLIKRKRFDQAWPQQTQEWLHSGNAASTAASCETNATALLAISPTIWTGSCLSALKLWHFLWMTEKKKENESK